MIRKEGFTYKYIILDIFYDCEALIKYDMLKELMLDKEDNIMVYVFPTSQLKYIVIDLPNMLSLPFPLMLAKFLAPSRDNTCASNYP